MFFFLPPEIIRRALFTALTFLGLIPFPCITSAPFFSKCLWNYSASVPSLVFATWKLLKLADKKLCGINSKKPQLYRMKMPWFLQKNTNRNTSYLMVQCSLKTVQHIKRIRLHFCTKHALQMTIKRLLTLCITRAFFSGVMIDVTVL